MSDTPKSDIDEIRYISKFTQQLTRVCDQNKEHRRLLNDLAYRMWLKKDASGNWVSMNTAMEVIPRKAKGKRWGGTPAAVGSVTRGRDTNGLTRGGCALCRKYSASTSNAWKTHSTKYCREWNSDGTSKPFQFGNNRGNGNDNGEPHGKKGPTLPS